MQILSNLLCRLMSDPFVEILGEELAALLRAPIKLESLSPIRSSNPVFEPPMSRMKRTAGRGRGRSETTSRAEPPRVNTKKTAQSRGGHRAASAGARQPSNPKPSVTRTPDSPPGRVKYTSTPKTRVPTSGRMVSMSCEHLNGSHDL